MKQESLERLASTMREQMASSQAYLADNAKLFMGMAIAQLRDTVTKSKLGLDKLRNLPPATITVAQQGLDTGYATPADVKAHVDFRLKGFAGEAGDSFFLNDNGFSNFIPGKFYEQLAVVTTTAELNLMLTAEEKMSDVFYNWKKISRGSCKNATVRNEAQYSDVAIQSEIDGFKYDAATDKITNALDSASLVGFVAPNAYENYVLDVVLRSTSSWQNDPLGLVLAYATDPDGTTHTLTVMRNPWPAYWTDKAVSVAVDYNTHAPVKIAGTSNGLFWADGQPATGPMLPAPPQPYAVKPWAQAPNGCRLRVTRAGDVFTVETTQYDGIEFVQEAKFTFTLNDHASLARFKGPQRYGYAAISQDNAIWDVIQRPGARQPIVDLRDRSIREWDGTQWVLNNAAWSRLLRPNRFFHNTKTNRLFYADNETTVIPIL